MGLVVDSSVSMWGIRDQVIDAAGRFAAGTHADDELFALAFNERVWPALRASEPFTSEALVLRRALTAAIAPRGKTALFDAVSAGVDYAARGSRAREVLVVISDGGDNASAIGFDDLVRKAEASNVVIYAVALADPNGGGHEESRTLQQLADATGGRMFKPSAPKDIDAALQAIGRDVRHAYTLAYAPAAQGDGAFHRLAVTVRSTDGKILVARTRAGYRARRNGATEASRVKP
jgi:VWFA-related protein